MRIAIVIASATAAGGVTYAAAATLGVGTGKLGSGQTAVTACDTDGFNFTRTLDASHDIATVTVSSINTACAGGTLLLTLTDASNAALGSGTASVTSSGSVTVTINTPPLAANVTAYRVAITS